MLRLEPRTAPSGAMSVLSPLIAAALTLACGSVLFAASGFAPLDVLDAFFVAPVSTRYGLGELGVKAAPLVLCASGLALGFRANVWNIGAEGQLTVGALAATGVALAAHGGEGAWTLPAMVLAGVAGGLAWDAIPAFLRTRFNASEILVTLMLTYVAILLLTYLVHGPWKDPTGFGFPQSREFGARARLDPILPGTRLHWGALFALGALGMVWFALARLFIGFQIKVLGLAPAAAEYAGFRERRLVWVVLLAGGGLAGLAGMAEVAGPIGQLTATISPGYGFTAIIVAFLGRLHPIGILFAGLLVALSYLGAESVQRLLGLPLAVAGVFQGMLLFFLLGSDVLVRFRVRVR